MFLTETLNKLTIVVVCSLTCYSYVLVINVNVRIRRELLPDICLRLISCLIGSFGDLSELIIRYSAILKTFWPSLRCWQWRIVYPDINTILWGFFANHPDPTKIETKWLPFPFLPFQLCWIRKVLYSQVGLEVPASMYAARGSVYKSQVPPSPIKKRLNRQI